VTKLPLAIEIADATKEGDRTTNPLEIDETAEKLHRAHPEAGSTKSDIAEALRETSDRRTSE
jgi:hypothetical protein